MNDCIHRNIENNICSMLNIFCDLEFRDIQAGDCENFESNFTKEDSEDLKFHEKREK